MTRIPARQAPADLGSREPLERARLHVAMASHALTHWHAGPSGETTTGTPYTAHSGKAVDEIDAALRALHDARAALVREARRDLDAALSCAPHSGPDDPPPRVYP
ncbi:hypothetical protein ACLQ2P_11640 [Actinomadura citrea]|uniref:hypothetical protein n=1 Tax=Actinomadura citrea TaxID=46158 RepID=UPI003CE47599